MRLDNGELVIREATKEDAQMLNQWWNDGELMKDVGFPDGLGESLEDTRRNILAWQGKRSKLCIIELDGRPIGECSIKYKLGDDSAYPGWKICDKSLQNRGIGPKIILMLFEEIFRDDSVSQVVWDTLQTNTRARHLYEDKFGVIPKQGESWTSPAGFVYESCIYSIDRQMFEQLKRKLL